MKKIIILIFVLILTTGCTLTKDNMENIIIYTSTYPIEYITKELYGENSRIFSIYPNEVIRLSNKLLNDYSTGDLFVYNGLSEEKDYAVKMINKNKRLMIVDAAMGMEYSESVEELWINPSNFLMLCQNIRNGMKEYITNSYLKKQIDNNYDELKLKISELDAEIKLMVENGNDSNLLVSNDIFLFLEKYKLNVLSLEDNEELTDKKVNDAKVLMKSGTIKYIVVLPEDKLSDEVEKLITDNKIEKLYYHPLTSITKDEELSDNDYITIMYKNIELLKKELYE